MIKVSQLSKKYGPYKAIEKLSFSVQKGQVVGFLGPNGAGKTTTMKIITGYMAPSSGQVSVAGYDVFESPLEVKKRIGYLPETPPLYPDMTVIDYLRFVARLKGVEKFKVETLVQGAIEKTNLGDVRNRVIENLSKGFRQRVGISGALVSDPEVLILDEPTVGLDPRQVAEIRQLIKELAGSHTIILSTHILPEVQAICERIIIINNGIIVAEDSLESLAQRMASGGSGARIVMHVRRSSESLFQALKQVEGVRRVSITGGGEASPSSGGVAQYEIEGDERNEKLVENLAALVVGQGAGLLELRSEKKDLENIFLELTAQPAEKQRS